MSWTLIRVLVKYISHDRAEIVEEYETGLRSVPGSEVSVDGVFFFEFVHEGYGEVLHRNVNQHGAPIPNSVG
ncbi:hypothetical protein ATJ93_4340 [Halopiger aswanensis]|uniref:Uncharacterized protein n=1 Tax=Halopiger aswanensis TaxID=148449 RepID=A0A3R7HVF7_9EURY|nr:hypothetical protein ATJ93_4340 [Halopiger aswanensis]